MRSVGRPRSRLVLSSVLFVVCVVVALVLQRATFGRVPWGQPDLVGVIVAAGSLARGPRVGAVWGLFAGLLCDLAPPASDVAGLWGFAFATTGFALGWLAHMPRSGGRDPFVAGPADRARARSRRTYGAVTFTASLVAALLHAAASGVVGRGVGSSGSFVLGALVGAVEAGVVAAW